MNPQDIRTSSDPDMAGSWYAMQRAARDAADIAIRTNTCLIVSVDGQDRRITAAELIKMREQETAQSQT